MLGIGVIAGAALLFARWHSKGEGSPREAATIPPWVPPSAPAPSYGGSSIDPRYPQSIWLPLIQALIVRDFPRQDARVAMKWMGMESDGAPCAYGLPDQKGPDGNPREIGLGQLFNADDFKIPSLVARGITPASQRAYCAPNSQLTARPLSSKEMEDQVYALLAKIDQSMHVADGAVAKYGLHWPHADYWKLVKSVHAWPPILNQGLPNVVKKLSRPPVSWAEFRQALGMDVRIKDDSPRSKTYGQMIPKYPPWVTGLNNSEKLASVVPADVGSV